VIGVADVTDEDTGYAFQDDYGVPRGEGTPPGEATIYDGDRRAREDLSCPNGCFELEVTAHHETGGADQLIDQAVQDEPGPCPSCGASLTDTEGEP